MDRDSSNRPGQGGRYQSRDGNRGRDREQKRVVEVLPSPEVLESYNYVVDGSAKMILNMFETEQKHRHEWEKQALKTHTFTSILGQILGFFIAICMFVSAAVLGTAGNASLGAGIWMFGTAIIFMTGIVWLYAKSMGQRPLFARPTFRSHFRPQKQRAEESAEEDNPQQQP